MAKLLIVYGTGEGQTRKISARIAETLREHGHGADVVDSTERPALAGSGYDAVIVAASIHRGRHQPAVARFVRENLRALERLPTAFFSVSLSAAGRQERQREAARQCAEAFLQETGWQPRMVRLVAGALAYSRYGWLTRLMMRFIASREGGDTDTSRDYEYTDWAELRRATELFLTQELAAAVPVPA